MTREEFGCGWTLLLAQPWGKWYRPDTDKTRAQLQYELYYKRLNKTNPYVWLAVCETYASGKDWPSILELKDTIRCNTPVEQVPLLDAPQPDPEPWPLILVKHYQRKEGCSLAQAALAVLPKWIADNPADENVTCATEFLARATLKFAPRTQKDAPSVYGMDDREHQLCDAFNEGGTDGVQRFVKEHPKS